MTKETMYDLIRSIQLPVGKCLKDGRTWKITTKDYKKLEPEFQRDLKCFDKVLILTDGKNPVGGVVFYGCIDIQLQVLPEYQGKGYASAIAHNGILKRECYPNQKATIMYCEVHCRADYELRHHLLDLIGVPVTNEAEILAGLKFQEAWEKETAEWNAQEVRERAEREARLKAEGTYECSVEVARLQHC